MVENNEADSIKRVESIYIRAIDAIAHRKDDDPAYEELRSLPLEKRHIWHIASGLKSALVSFDHDSAVLDRQMMSLEDLETATQVARRLPFQFCLLLKTLMGQEAMEATMKAAISDVTVVGC